MTDPQAKIGVVDAGIGTWKAFITILEHLGVRAEVTRAPELLGNFSHLILPGVGNFVSASSQLQEGGWTGPLVSFAESGKPFLGVCLGMQLLGSQSAEGLGSGLGLIEFESTRLPSEGPYRVPNIGWSSLAITENHNLFENQASDARFYFSHSFGINGVHPNAIAKTLHNSAFTSVIAKGNVAGAQFHPEKSQLHGINFLRNFVNW